MEKAKQFFSSSPLEKEKATSVNEDFESGSNDIDELAQKVEAIKSLEFDPVTSQLQEAALHDEYAAITVEDDSPYPEVRAAVPSTDDPSLPQNTIRMWFLAFILSTIGAGMNLLFSLHAPSFTVTTFVTSILAWPIGVAWGKWMPNANIFGAPLNPGPFNVKEHTLIVIAANVSFGGGAAYATDILLSLTRFYGKDFGWGFDLLLIFSTQCIGFALGGIARRVLVHPPSMIWPLNLVSATFLTNMHINENHPANGWRISRLAFFAIVFACSFVWYFFPGYIFPALSYFAFPTWIKPDNVIVNQVFGASSGLGLIPITFDWNQIAGYIGSPLIPPVGTIMTIFASIVVIFWIVVPAVHYSNVWYAQYLPISSSGSYDNTANTYNVSKIINKETLTFIPEAYKEYSPLFLSTTFAISYGLSFAAILATLVHTALFHGKDIIRQLKLQEKPDVHMRLMKQYKEIPDWWYVVVFVIFFALSIVTIEVWDTEMPVWCLVIALLIAIVFLLPVGVIYALTNIAVGLNVVTEFIIGYMLPGKPIAMMLFKTFGYITNNQAVTFAQDMKLGHYMKLAPRLVFAVQFAGCLWGCVVQIAVLRWSYGAIDHLCEPALISNNYTCPGGKVFFNASIIWGVIGPGRQFSHGQIYYGLLFFFIVGAITPVINWLVLKKWPNSPIKWLNWPVFFSGTGNIPPATPYNYASYSIVGLIFGGLIKKRFFHWWAKYNYSLSAGLDIGLAWSTLIIFLTLNLTNTNFPNWWGTTVIDTPDTNVEAIRHVLEPGETFGPSKW